MWTRNVVWVAVVVGLVAGCGSEDEGDNPGGTGGGGAGGAGGAGGSAGTAGTSGAGGMGGTSGGGAGGMGGSGGFMLPECPMEPGPSMCGTNTCTQVEPGALCVKTCCTTDMQCGTESATATTCVATTAGMCPNATVIGQNVPGCCVEGTNDCGIVNTLSGDPPCVRRQDVPFMPLSPMHCDGTPVMNGGMGGMGGEGGMGGMGGEGGMGGMGGDTADAGL